MKTLCKYLGGSHLYGMSTPQSDVDYRGVFMNTDPLNVYGFHRIDNHVKQTSQEDLVFHELTQFIKLATKSNTQTLECLFAPLTSFTEVDEDFYQLVLVNKHRFLNTNQLFKSLEGYLYNEMRLALGERTGLLGSKRKVTLEQYGFSYKNFGHLFRLAECGIQFFKFGHYPVRISDSNKKLHDFIMDLKTSPGSFNKEDLTKKANEAREAMREAYDSCTRTYVPDYEYCGKVLQHFYSKHLC